MPDLLTFDPTWPADWSPQQWRHAASLMPLLAAMAVAAAIDWRSRRIPNWLTFTLLGTGLLRGLAGGLGWVEAIGPGGAVLGALVGFALAVPLFVLGARGAGDAKLYIAAGAWVGPGGILALFLVEAIVGAVFVVGHALARGRAMRLLSNTIVLATTLLNVRRLGLATATAAGQHLTVYNRSGPAKPGEGEFKSIDRPLPHAVPALVAAVACLVLGHL